jgi:ParB-like chromosome segregation protein Spo0J
MESSVSVRVRELLVDSSLQPRVGGIDADHVQALEETPESWPPIKVVRQDERYLLVDGSHRVEAARNLGIETVRVQVIDPPADGDLHALAFALNATHGRPLSLADRRAFAERLLRAQPYLADREIARRCGLAANTVGTIRERLEESAQIEQTTERVGHGGYVYRPRRKDGELPETDPVETIGDFFVKRKRRQQRRIARYLEQLAVALDDQYKLKGWETHEDAVNACRAILDEERVAEQAQELGDGAHNVLQVAIALGYEDSEE